MHLVSEDARIQQKINIKEEEFKARVIGTYQKFLHPYRAFGKNSRQAESIVADEQNLLKAYNLFKAVRDANQQQGDSATFIRVTEVRSPLTERECYTVGGEFIYLQCWLMFAQNARDFIPELVAEEGMAQTTYHLQFSPLKTYGFNYLDKEVIAAVRGAFHPAE